MNFYLTPAEMAESCSAAGAEKAKRPAGELVILGLLAGAFLGVAGAACNVATCGISDPLAARVVSAFLFPFGLCMVILLGAELFTGNCLLAVSVLDRRCPLIRMLRNWLIVYPSNFAGALLVAAACTLSGQLSSTALAIHTMKVAVAKCALPFGKAFLLGLLCNVLVCLAVLLASSARDNLGRVIGACLPVCLFVLCGFEHSIADMYYISAGLFAKAAFPLAAAGLDLTRLTLTGFLFDNLLPVTLGNLAGGLLLSLAVWYCNLRGREEPAFS